MLYDDARRWREAPAKSVALIGMSGVGKTRVSTLLRDQADWFHYSVDYRIGTRYLGERITDEFKREAMKLPKLRELLRTDSIRIDSKLSFHNLTPLATWLGKPGDPEKGGIPFDDYLIRQRLHREAEIAAILDARAFIDRAREVYDYPNFICDTSGSICEVVDPSDPLDRVLAALSRSVLPVYIRGTEADEDALKARFDRAPKPMYYQPRIMRQLWDDYKLERGITAAGVVPDEFIRFAYGRAIRHRVPLYDAMARNWGITVKAADVATVRDATDVTELVAAGLERHSQSA